MSYRVTTYDFNGRPVETGTLRRWTTVRDALTSGRIRATHYTITDPATNEHIRSGVIPLTAVGRRLIARSLDGENRT